MLSTDPLIGRNYDELRKELQRWDQTIAFDDVGASVVDGEKYTHTEHMLNSRPNADRLQTFVKKGEKAAKEVGVKTIQFKVTPKLDGMAANTRCRTTRGNLVSQNVTHISIWVSYPSVAAKKAWVKSS